MYINYKNKELKLKFDFNALCEIEDIANKSLPELLKQSIGFKTIRILIWGALQHDLKPNLNDVGEIIQSLIDQGQTLETITALISNELEKSGILGKNETGK
jgi:hypothetical protein